VVVTAGGSRAARDFTSEPKWKRCANKARWHSAEWPSLNSIAETKWSPASRAFRGC